MFPSGPPRVRAAVAVAGALLVGLSACTSGSSGSTGTPASSSVSTSAPGLAGGDGETGSTTAPTSRIPSTPRPTPGATLVTETAADSCPYIATQAAADAEGNRIGQVSVLRRGGSVMGCRFRFAYGDNHYTLEISSVRYGNAVSAYNAMVRQGTAGRNAAGFTLSTGDQGVRYRTTFYAADDGQDWAFVFARGAVVVTVKTDQSDTSQNAVSIAELIAAKFG